MALVIAGTPEVELTVSVTLALPVPEELVAVTVNVEVPAAGSVPEINPCWCSPKDCGQSRGSVTGGPVAAGDLIGEYRFPPFRSRSWRW